MESLPNLNKKAKKHQHNLGSKKNFQSPIFKIWTYIFLEKEIFKIVNLQQVHEVLKGKTMKK